MNELKPVNGEMVSTDKVFELEAVLKQMNQAELEVTHHFAPHVYTRVLYMPAGTMLTGKVHRHELMNILVSGTMRFVCEGSVYEETGFAVFNSGVGSKKAIYALTDCIFLGVHPTDLTDLKEIEQEFIVQESELCG